MTQGEITTAVRLAIREPNPQLVMDTQIESLSGRAITLLWLQMQQIRPMAYYGRVSLTSYTNQFDLPSDCERVLSLWDIGDTAKTITGATNATPIKITAGSHGFDDGNLVTIHDVGGNTAANGTWTITYVDADNFTLDGSVGNGAWISGGKVFNETGDFIRLDQVIGALSTGSDETRWFYRDNDTIAVDDVEFEYDLVIDYLKTHTPVLADIPARFHEAIVAFAVMNVLQPRAGNVNDATTLKFYSDVFSSVSQAMVRNLKSLETPMLSRATPASKHWL